MYNNILSFIFSFSFSILWNIHEAFRTYFSFSVFNYTLVMEPRLNVLCVINMQNVRDMYITR